MSVLFLAIYFGIVTNVQKSAFADSQDDKEKIQGYIGAMPQEKHFGFIQDIITGRHAVRWDASRTPLLDEIALPPQGWKIVVANTAGSVLRNAVEVFRVALFERMNVDLSLSRIQQPFDSTGMEQVIIVGDQKQIKNCPHDLKASKDYHIQVFPKQIFVCGFDAKGAMHGLYNILARFRLQEAPFLKKSLNVTRHSLHEKRMTLTALGWMRWPDSYLEQLSLYGFDAIYASVYANANGSKPPKHYSKMRLQNPSRIKDLIQRASRYGIDVYCPIMFEIKGDGQDEMRLEKLIGDHVKKFPKMKGYILLIEGFYYRELPKTYWKDRKIRNWIKHWQKGVALAVKTFKKLSPETDILVWDYNIDFRPKATVLKQDVVRHYPKEVIPLITWENGKEISFDGEKGYLKDYGISEIGPSEVASAQIKTIRKRHMKVYAKADGWASWQFGTLPYIPVPQQWHKRSLSLSSHKVDGTLESWTYGFQPNFIAELRGWQSWSNAPPLDDLLAAAARRKFGARGAENALLAWKEFSKAIRTLPATGPYVATNNSVAAPFFWKKTEALSITVNKSFYNPGLWSGPLYIRPDWPYSSSWLILQPDFANKRNVVKTRFQHVKPFSFAVYDKYMKKTEQGFEKGLKYYRKAVLHTPQNKRYLALKELIIVEEIQRLLQSARRLYKFENLRFSFFQTTGLKNKTDILGQARDLAEKEYKATQSALIASQKDSRLGYQWPYDYIYNSLALKAKIRQLNTLLKVTLPQEEMLNNARPQRPVLLSKPLAKSSLPRARFVMSHQNNVSFECQVNGKGFKKCANPFIIRVLPDGKNSIDIRARNSAGHLSLPFQYSWMIDARYPFEK